MRFSDSNQIKAVLLAACTVASLAATSVASAQERLPVRGGNGFNEERAGATFLKSGAMLFVAFDQNIDLEITREEIEAGGALAFVHADQDENGVLTPIEQRNWASRFSGENDVIANPRLFPAAIPNQVTQDEFILGLLTLAERFEDEDGRIFLENLTFRPDRSLDDREDGGFIERLQRPNVAERSGPNG